MPSAKPPPPLSSLSTALVSMDAKNLDYIHITCNVCTDFYAWLSTSTISRFALPFKPSNAPKIRLILPAYLGAMAWACLSVAIQKKLS
uniref:Transmembrane protein n=1 Tax=Panagrellus redivivus TaxID=6233 RepID=A0A7E4URC0_PANRE